METPNNSEPILNAPGSVSGLVVLLFAIHIGLYFLPENIQGLIFIKLAYIPLRFTQTDIFMLDPIGAILSPVGHSLLHGGWMHLFVNAGMLLAFGSVVARVASDGYFYFIYCLGALAGAATMTAIDPQSIAPMIGASGAVSALLGAIAGIALKFRGNPGGPFVNQQKTFSFIGFWLVINVVFGLVPGEYFGINGRIAWEAHIGGFAIGLILPFLAPPRLQPHQ